MSKKTTIILSVIITIVVLLNILGTTSDSIVDSANAVTDANNCSDGTDTVGETLTYDQSTKFCTNSTEGQVYLAKQYDLPLNSLFGTGGVLLLVVMASILFIIIRIAMMKKQ